MAKSLRELYEESLSGKFTRVYDVFGSGPSQETITLAGQTHIPAPVEGDGPFEKDAGNDALLLLRGGINAPIAAGLDEIRIGKFLLSTNGALSLVKQSVLQLQNPNTSYRTIAFPKNENLTDNQLFDYTGVLASVAGTAFGLHFDRHGLIPSTNNDPYSTPGGYLSLNTTPDVYEPFQSRLLIYTQPNSKFRSNTNEIVELNSYWGGSNPLSKDFGQTKITTVQNTFGRNDAITNKAGKWAYNEILKYGSEYSKLSGSNQLVPADFSKYPKDFRNKITYQEFNIHNRVGVTSNRSSIGNPNTTVDSINILTITPRATFYDKSDGALNDINSGAISSDLIYSGLYNQNNTKEKARGKYGRDIIKFRIEIVNNDAPLAVGKTGTALNTDVLAFRAYLENMSDNFSPQWKEFNYMGRGESFFTYEGFKRDIQFSFILFAHSEEEMPAIYTKLNYLMSSMAPDYNDRYQMRGNYALLTIGDYIYQQPGVFTSMVITDHLTAPWEIAVDEPELRANLNGSKDIISTAKQHEVPKYMKVAMTFKPIHNFLPKRNHRNDPHTSTFITPNFKIGHPNHYLPQGVLPTAKDKEGNPILPINNLINLPNNNDLPLPSLPLVLSQPPAFIGPKNNV